MKKWKTFLHHTPLSFGDVKAPLHPCKTVNPPPPPDVLVSDAAPLAVVYQSADMMAAATVPCMMLGLGATLITTRGGKALPLGVIVGVAAVRLVLLPALGVWAVLGALWYTATMCACIVLLEVSIPK